MSHTCHICVTLRARLRNNICDPELFLDKNQRLQVVIGHGRKKIRNHSVKWNHYGKEGNANIHHKPSNKHARTQTHKHKQNQQPHTHTHNQTNTQQIIINMHKQMQSINPTHTCSKRTKKPSHHSSHAMKKPSACESTFRIPLIIYILRRVPLRISLKCITCCKVYPLGFL